MENREMQGGSMDLSAGIDLSPDSSAEGLITDESTTQKPDGTKSGLSVINELVSSYVSTKGADTRDGVIQHLATEELFAREKKTLDAINHLKKLQGELKAVAPDIQEMSDSNGKIIQPAGWGPASTKKRKQISDEILKVEAALDGIFRTPDTPDFSKLKALQLPKNDGKQADSNKGGRGQHTAQLLPTEGQQSAETK